jgi:hypothetical protein
MLLGNQWLLAIYPGGNEHADEGMVSLFLWNMSEKSIDIDFGSVTTIERGVVTDCTERRRFEVVSQYDWESNPFSSVYANTASAKELDLVHPELPVTH